MHPDLVLVNANVVTLDSSRLRSEAVAVKYCRIAFVGSNKAALKMADRETKVLDLKKKTLLPGFIDTHVHLDDFGLTLRTLNLEEATSVVEVRRLLA